MLKIAEVFTDKGYQTVRLPEDILLPDGVVSIRQDDCTGEIILSPYNEADREARWKTFLDLLDQLGPIDENLLAHRDRSPLEPRKFLLSDAD